MEQAKVSKSGIPYLHFGCGEPLVLIHGLGEVKEGWQHQYELADQYELIIPDLRGHGECTKIDGISIPNFAADVIGLLKELQIENAYILGLSMGGAVAQEIYRQAPDLCRSLLLVSTFHFFPKKLRKILFKSKKSKFKKLLASGGQNVYAAHLALYSWKEDNVEKGGGSLPLLTKFRQSTITSKSLVLSLPLSPYLSEFLVLIGPLNVAMSLLMLDNWFKIFFR